MRWVLVIAAVVGLFYLGRLLMPNPTAINTRWMLSQVKQGMTKDEVARILGGDPESRSRTGIGSQETWFYTDMYDSKDSLQIDFIDGRVISSQILDQ